MNEELKTSSEGRKFIEQFEGLILGAYDDANDRVVHPGDHIRGTLTIGYGHTSAAGPPKVYPGMNISAQTADEILAADLAAVELSVKHHVTVPLKQHEFDALVSFDFNTGALHRSNVIRAINAGLSSSVVCKDLMMWDHASGRVLPGLYRRRAAEGKLYSTGVY